MQQRCLLQILLLAQHVSGTTMPIIRSSRVLYSGCCLWHFVLWFSSCWSGVELRVMCPVCRMLQHPANRTHNPQLHTRPTTVNQSAQVPQAATICINLELLMMGIMVPETCWANSKFCNKKTNMLHLVCLLFPRINDDARSDSHQDHFNHCKNYCKPTKLYLSDFTMLPLCHRQ